MLVRATRRRGRWRKHRRRGLAAFVAIGAALCACGTAPPSQAEQQAQLARSYEVQQEDTFVDIARAFDLGYVELVAANPGVDPWLPGVGRRIVIPDTHLPPAAPPHGIVINLGDLRLYYFAPGGSQPLTFPIGIGQEGWGIPLSHTTVIRKRVNPTWVPPASIRAERPDLPAAIPPGPDNPMGGFALDLGWTSYAIHGTNTPYAVGRRVTHGCIRLYPEDIERLFPLIPVGTHVTVVEQPVKFAWRDGELYMESHATGLQVDELEQEGQLTPQPVADLDELVRDAAGPQSDRIDWVLARQVALERSGVPVRITRPVPEGAIYRFVPGPPPAAPAPVAASPVAPSPVALGPWWLWLGSTRSAGEVNALAAGLAQDYKDLLGSLTLTTRRNEWKGNKTVYFRLYAGSLPTLSAATELCSKLKLRNADATCVPMLMPSS